MAKVKYKEPSNYFPKDLMKELINDGKKNSKKSGTTKTGTKKPGTTKKKK